MIVRQLMDQQNDIHLGFQMQARGLFGQGSLHVFVILTL